MPTNYPTNIDTFTPLVAGTSPGSSTMNDDPAPATTIINNIQDPIEALETKVGVDGSAVTTTIDYQLNNASSVNPGHKHTLADSATDVTASAAELNVLDGATVTTAEINYLDVATPGIAEANKAAILGATKNLDVVVIDKSIKFNCPEGFLINGVISRTVTSNNLTVAILTASGTAPSASDPVYVGIDGTVRTITSALSITLNAGTNYWNYGASGHAALERDYFDWLGWKASDSTVVLGVTAVPYGRFYSDFVSTNTNPMFMAVSATPAATDVFNIVGRHNATLSAAAGHNWSIPAISILINRPITETRLLTWNPTLVGWGTPPTGGIYTFQLRVSGEIEFFIRQPNSATSNSTATSVSAPVRALTLTGYSTITPLALDDNGTAGFGRTAVNSADTIITCNPTFAGGNWTASGGKRLTVGQGVYRYV